MKPNLQPRECDACGFKTTKITCPRCGGATDPDPCGKTEIDQADNAADMARLDQEHDLRHFPPPEGCGRGQRLSQGSPTCEGDMGHQYHSGKW